MKKATILAFCLLMVGAVVPMGGSNAAQSDDTIQAYWQKFKHAVISEDKEAVARLSRFPIGIADAAPNTDPAHSIKSSAELRLRFRELFSDHVNAAQCFTTKGPSRDTENPERFTVGCPNEAGSDVAVYEFEHTKLGWRLSHFQPTTTCRCR